MKSLLIAVLLAATAVTFVWVAIPLAIAAGSFVISAIQLAAHAITAGVICLVPIAGIVGVSAIYCKTS